MFPVLRSDPYSWKKQNLFLRFFDGEMLIRFEKYSLHFLQQLGESNFVQTSFLGEA